MATVQDLANQLRAQYSGGGWDQGGVDRSMELAQMLWGAGVRDASQIGVKDGIGYTQYSNGENLGDGNFTASTPTQMNDGRALDFGGVLVGNLGDRGAGGGYDGRLMPGVDNTGRGSDELGWSSAGHGNVGYEVGYDASGRPLIFPSWGSSSDSGDGRDLIKGLAKVAASAYGAYGIGSAAGVAGAGAGEGAAGAFGGAGADAAAEGAIGGAGGYGAEAGAFANGLGNTGLIDAVAPATAAGASGALPALQIAGGSLVPSLGTLASTAGLAKTGLDVMRQGELQDYSSNGSMPSSPAIPTGMGSAADTTWLDQLKKLAPYAKGLSPLLGAVAGAASSSGDQMASKTYAPWGPAQPLILQQLGNLSKLSGDLTQQPFSPFEQGAVGNQVGLLNAVNQMAPQLWGQNSRTGRRKPTTA